MKKILSLLAISGILTGCGQSVEVEPAHIGKILGQNGYAPETISPRKFRLEPCISYCDKLITLEVSDKPLLENIKVFMPKDKLNLDIDIRGTFSIPNNQKITDSIFDRVPATPSGKISAGSVYKTYGKQAVRGVVRSEITKYSIQEILSNRDSISQNIHKKIIDTLKETKTPIIISRFQLAKVQPPPVIVEAQESAKKREIEIQEAEADAQVKLTQAELALDIAKKNRLVEREKAESIAEQNEIAAKSITPEVLAYKRLETAEKIFTEMAKNENVVFLPVDSTSFQNISDDAILSKLIGKEVKR